MKKNPSPRVCYPVGQVKREWACSWTLPDLWSLPFNLSSLALPLPKTSFPLPHRSRGNFLLLPIGKAYRYPAAFGWSDLGLIYIYIYISVVWFHFLQQSKGSLQFHDPLKDLAPSLVNCGWKVDKVGIFLSAILRFFGFFLLFEREIRPHQVRFLGVLCLKFEYL